MVERLSAEKLAQLRGDLAVVQGQAPTGPAQPMPQEPGFFEANPNSMAARGVSPVEAVKAAGQNVLGTAEAAGRGYLSGVAGLISAPYELPALAEAGYDYFTGNETPATLPLGAGYTAVGDALFGDLYKLPEDRPWWERGVYYAGEAGVGGVQQAGRSMLQGAAGGLIAEENTAAGVGVGLIPTGRTPKPKTSTIERQGQEAQDLGRQLTNETGLQETRGMQEYRAALELPDGSQEQLNALAKAKETLALEELGRRTPEGLGGYNTTSWAWADYQRQVALEDTLQRLAGATGQVDAASVTERVAKAFNSWEKARIDDFKARNRADFESIPQGVYFDMESVRARFDAIADKYQAIPADADDFTRTRAIDSRLAMEKFMARLFDKDGNAKDLTAQEIQEIMSELGDVAWKGSGPGFEDLTPGVAKAMARELLYGFKGVLDDVNLTGQQREAAEALQTARANFNARLEALNVESNRSFIKFGISNLDSATPDQLLTQLKAITQDTSTPTRKGQIEIIASLIRKEDPALWGEVKQLIFEDAFEGLRDSKGMIDFEKLQKATLDLRKNKLLFGDKGDVNAFDGFIRQLQGVFARYDRDIMSFADVTDFYRAGKTSAEALGAAFGPKGRYLGELAVKVGQLLRKGKFDPKMAAYFANNPDARLALIKSLKGEFKDLNTAQIRALQGAALYGRIYLTTTIPSIYISREEQ